MGSISTFFDHSLKCRLAIIMATTVMTILITTTLFLQPSSELGETSPSSPAFMDVTDKNYDWRIQGPHVPWFDTNQTESERFAIVNQESWEKMGRDMVWHSVLTGFDKTKELTDEDRAKFYKSGEDMMEWWQPYFLRNGIHMKGESALELGCGVGRLALALAKRYRTVTCLDFSQPHLTVAREEALKRGVHNIIFTLSTPSMDLTPRFSFINSALVIQHSIPPLQTQYISDACHMLVPGGSAFMLVPTYIPGYEWNAERAEKSVKIGGMQMHATPQREVLRAISSAGCTTLSVIQHDFTGIPDSENGAFLFYKPT